MKNIAIEMYQGSRRNHNKGFALRKQVIIDIKLAIIEGFLEKLIVHVSILLLIID